MLGRLLAALSRSEARVSLTGQSAGGAGAWHFAVLRKELWASVWWRREEAVGWGGGELGGVMFFSPLFFSRL